MAGGVTSDEDSPDKIAGDTDGTLIGNVGDRLKVDAVSTASPIPSVDVFCFDKQLLNSLSSKNMDVDGSVTEVNFQFAPGAGEIFFLSAIAIYMGEASGLAFNKFENIATLTNGVKIEIQSNGTVKEKGNYQDNTDISRAFFAGGSTGSQNSFSGLFNLKFSTKLVGDDGDYIRMIVRDDLTTVTHLSASAILWQEQ